jgi:hypothetical protein
MDYNFLEAVAREEGYYVKGSRPQRNNNPGDIEFGTFAEAHGATKGTDGRFAIFDSPEAGFAAMKALFQSSHYIDLTVSEALNRWAPPVENKTNLYIVNVCKWTGLLPSTRLSEALANC